MIAPLKPYPAYKDSGVQWLGDVPQHWETRPLKRWVQINHTVLRENTPPDYEFSYIDIGSVETGYLRSRPMTVRFANAPSRARRVVQQGDTILSTVRTYLKAVYYIRERADHLICSTGFAVLTPAHEAAPGYIGYLVQSEPFTATLAAQSVGTAYPAIAESRLGAFHVAVPPLPEQHAIARFLDYIDGRINRYIRAKRKLIALLNEQKQAIIHQAVTRGLDPDVPLKPSGVEWLGDIPAHWEVRRLKRVAEVQTGLTLGKTYLGSETNAYPYLRVANVQHGSLDLSDVKEIDVPAAEAMGALLRPGDVLMTEGGDIDKLGRGCVWRSEIPNCLHQNHIFAVRCSTDWLLPDILAGLMVSQHGRAYFQSTAKQTTNLASTNSTTLRSFPVLLPPLHEQQQILSYFKEQLTTVGGTVDRTIREIDLIREYRTRLIADVVTGKVDVRGVELPPEQDLGPEELEDEAADEWADEPADWQEEVDAGN
jgi:type I restriction enzyme, S subunit